MSEPNTTPKTWAEAAAGWTDEFFQMRLYQCDSLPHLRKAVEYEANTRCRTERIKKINKQIEESK